MPVTEERSQICSSKEALEVYGFYCVFGIHHITGPFIIAGP